MKAYIKDGWQVTAKHFPIISILFLYQLLWGFFLYRFIGAIIVPLLKRYPDVMGTDSAAQLFLVEAQFQLLKTDIIYPYLWALAGLFGIRMVITPLINAGLFHSLQHISDKGGTTFFIGIRRSWKPVAIIYYAEQLLAFGPLLWLIPLCKRTAAESLSLADMTAALVPYLLCWILWCAAIRLLSLSLQFGAAAGQSFANSLMQASRTFLPLAGVSLAMWGIGILIGAASSAASLFWAGLLAVMLHQAHHFIRTWLKVWTLAAQHKAWKSKEV
ncbi:hypothetical protein DNH61_08070 [Paenibacillus sambharensis]|uniref:Uncharacterized protein n=1 Tax=Paenibacillus sambharensis TaxID=1803190 RepID=A0A2W1LNE1_9BACL|nr:hypothetical protein [Paenibacillus sambharensis]PZD96452.1 hypothetical protein DNH61_08070 [Paenibacillus sambharensis]